MAEETRTTLSGLVDGRILALIDAWEPGQLLDFKGVTVTQLMLDRLRAKEGFRASFADATFADGGTSFNGAVFGDGRVDFRGAHFGDGLIDFQVATLGEGFVDFRKATFGNCEVRFTQATFGDGYVNFSGATFGNGNVSFSGATFGAGGVSFLEADFGDGIVSFADTNFGDGDVTFRGVNFGDGDVEFHRMASGDGDVDFGWATFGNGHVSFDEATLGDGSVRFAHATLGDGAVSFDTASFGHGNVSFFGATVGDGNVSFGRTVFGDGNVDFGEANFGDGNVDFGEANFGDGNVDFGEANFGDGWISFARATFGDGWISFARATLGDGRVLFGGASFGKGSVSFGEAKFGNGDVSFDGLASSGETTIQLDKADWAGRGELHVSCVEGSAVLELNGVRIGADVVIGVGPGVAVDAERLVVRAPTELFAVYAVADDAPTLRSLDRADITAPFRIGRGIDLSETVFGDQDLTRIEIAGTDSLPRKPSRSYHPRLARLFPKRRALAADLSDDTDLAVLERNYRDLRRSLEAAGNNHVASDFYVGEMEARRRRASLRSVERWLLEVYEVVSGYGTRAIRPIVAWLLLTLASARVLRINGIDLVSDGQVVGFKETWLFAVNTSLSLLRPLNAPALSAAELLFSIVLRTVGPVLLALAALGLRNRVKR